MNFDKCFIGATGISLDKGFSTSMEGIAEGNKAVMRQSKESYLSTDASKLSFNSRYHFAVLE